MKKKLLLLIPIALLMLAPFGANSLCAYIDQKIFEDIFSPTGSQKVINRPRVLTNKQQCEWNLELMEVLNKEPLYLIDFLSEFDQSSSTIRTWLWKLGYTRLIINNDQKELQLKRLEEELKIFTKQNFGRNTTKWRNYLKLSRAKSSKLGNYDDMT